MEEYLGSSISVFIGLTVILFGFAAFMTGQSLANTWRPVKQAFPYCLLLACANRFLSYALFEGRLFDLSGLIADFVVLLAICLVAYRATRTRQMVRQYPWIYEQSSPFTWKDRG